MVMMEMDPVNVQVEALRKRLDELKTQQVNDAKHRLGSMGRLDPGAMAYSANAIDKAQTNELANQTANFQLNELGYQRDLPFKEAGLTGLYNGKATMQSLGQMLPLMQSGALNKDYYGSAWDSSKFNTDAELDINSPEYQAAKKYGYANPYEMNLDITNPEYYAKKEKGVDLVSKGSSQKEVDALTIEYRGADPVRRAEIAKKIASLGYDPAAKLNYRTFGAPRRTD
jgi:hypothetical protein